LEEKLIIVMVMVMIRQQLIQILFGSIGIDVANTNTTV
jgi:hypothetical protein